MRILIYNDIGAQNPQLVNNWLKTNLSNYDIEYVNAYAIKEHKVLDASNVRALFMPGGQSRFFKRQLEGKGDEAIEKFVNNGGAYYGICGGGYYPCKTIDFSGSEFNILKDNKQAVFFEGTAKGSIPELTSGSYYSTSFNSVAAVGISYGEGDRAVAYYHGGASFIGDFNSASTQVLASYSALPEDRNASIIKCNVGRGFALLSGIHPEIGYKDIDLLLRGNFRDKENMLPVRSVLKSAHERNKNFHKFILKDLI